LVVSATSGILGAPWWAGVGVILSLLLFLGSELRRHREARKAEGRRLRDVKEAERRLAWRVFDLSDTQRAGEYYDALSASIKSATDHIYRSGRGFGEIKRGQEVRVQQLIAAERFALDNGVEITRIQTSPRANEVWANAYATLMDDFPKLLDVRADYSDPPLVNVGVVDPSGAEPVVQLLFESRDFSLSKDRYRAATSIFLYGRSEVATSVGRQFNDRVEKLDRLDAAQVRRLCVGQLYFAYGSNLSTRQMHSRCPGARPVGPAVLYGWNLRFCVAAPHLGGATAGIEPSQHDNDLVWGLVWDLSTEDKSNLDATEHGGYKPLIVRVKFVGSGQDESAFTYVPVERQTQPTAAASAYLNDMIAGATEHHLDELRARLERIRDNGGLERPAPQTT
jgi:hypothetical protein